MWEIVPFKLESSFWKLFLFVCLFSALFLSVCEVRNRVRQWEMSVTCNEMGRLFLAENSHILKGFHIYISVSEICLLRIFVFIFSFSQRTSSSSYAILSVIPWVIPKSEQKITLWHFALIYGSICVYARSLSPGQAPGCHSCSASRAWAGITALQMPRNINSSCSAKGAYSICRVQKTFLSISDLVGSTASGG